MNITQVKVFPVAEEKLKAYVSIVLDDCFLVSDLKVGYCPMNSKSWIQREETARNPYYGTAMATCGTEIGRAHV